MAITLYGVDPSIDELRWAQLHALATDTRVNGLAVTASGGTRGLSIGTGEAYAAGVYAISNATGTVTLATNTSGQARIDYVVLQIDWTLTQTTGGTLTSVTGTPAATPVAPNLTQTAGVKWQIPLARVTVGSDNATLTIESVWTAASVAQRPIPYNGSLVSTSTTPSLSSMSPISTITVNDPGWKYQVMVSATVPANGGPTFDSLTFGGTALNKDHFNLNAYVDGQLLGVGRTGYGYTSPGHVGPYWTTPRSGVKTTIQLMAQASGSALAVENAGFRFLAVVHPSN